MAPGKEDGNSWLEDLKELILKKKEESAALKKFQESFQSIGHVKDIDKQSIIQDNTESCPEENHNLNNQNKPSNP